MIEIECKFEINSPQKIEKDLKKLGYVKSMPRTYELSVMFDNAEGLMQSTDGRIRARQSGDTVEFCYKKPLTRKVIKKEIEYEVEVTNFETLEKILIAMGYDRTTSYERFRTEYNYNGVKATIDEYPFSSFLELEGDEIAIKDAAKALSLDIGDNLTDSCDTLFQNWRKQNGLKFAPHMLFESYDK